MIVVKLRHAMEISSCRTGQKWTYEQLAQATGLAKATVEALGSRTSYNTTLSTIDRLCGVLECDLLELLEYQPDAPD